MIKSFFYNNKQIALLIRSDFSSDTSKFFTDDSLPQQVGYIKHDKGHQVTAHIHSFSTREVLNIQETLIIRKGKLRVDLYSDTREYIESTVLNKGDVIILISGGHGVYFIEDSEIIEVKQGPYLPEDDKLFIKNVKSSEVKINE